MKNFFRSLGCSIIGWDKDILNQCGETSARHYRKLLAATVITMILWGLIGYILADRHIKNSLLFNITMTITFMGISLCLDRAIIMSKSKMTAFLRILIAFCFTLIGTGAIGVVIFQKDIEGKTNNRTERSIRKSFTTRIPCNDVKQKILLEKMDSLTQATILLGDSLYKQEDLVSKNKTITRPILEQIKANNSQMRSYVDQFNELNVQEEKVTYGDQINALYTIILSNKIAMIYYCVMSLYLFLMEMLILFIKTGENKCDYELFVEQQINLNQMKIKTSN